MIELSILRYFVCAYEAKTFSKAARESGVSQPTVSAAIQRLEDRLGAPLFQRSKSGLTPTPLATKLYHDTRNSVTHLATLESRMLNQPQQEVRVYSAPDMLINGLASGLSSLRAESENLIFSFTDDVHESDIAYLSKTCVSDSHKFLPLAEEPFGVAFSHKHPLAYSGEVRLEDIRQYPIIHRPYCPNADRMDLDPVLVRPAAQAMNDPQLLDLIAVGLGIAFTPRSHAESRSDIVWVPLKGVDAGVRSVGISHRRSAMAAGLAKKLVQFLKTSPGSVGSRRDSATPVGAV